METYGVYYNWGTQESGYLAKQILAAMQTEVLDDEGTDCKTTKTIEITLTPKILRDFEWRYIVENGKYVCLTPEVISNYVGKTVHLRSPMYCKNDHICVHCAGTLYKRIGLKNVGCVISNATGALLNLSLKKMHDSSVKVSKLNMDEYITEH